MSESPAATLADIRRRLRLSQKAFGRQLGVSTRTIFRWERAITAAPPGAVARALALLGARDPELAGRIGVAAGIPGAVAQETARGAALDHAVFAAAEALDISPRRARTVLAHFLTHLAAAGLSAVEARRRLTEALASGAPDAHGPAPAGAGAGAPVATR